MTDSVRVSAPCKINLHLRVLGARPDGFHDIESVFQLISLADDIELSRTGAPLSCEVVSPRMELPPSNTVTAAVERFRELTGITDGVRVRVTKRVPSGAGLGGGSSDAASTLVALDRLFGTNVPPEELAVIAAKIGSDVPFFLTGGAAVVEGRGERITPIRARTDLTGVLVWPGVASPTGPAYALVDRYRAEGREGESAGLDGTPAWPKVADLERWSFGTLRNWPFRNSFTAPVEEAIPVIRDVRLGLLEAGADFAEMSGSGSSVFGLFENEAVADSACRSLSTQGKFCVKFLLLASSGMR